MLAGFPDPIVIWKTIPRAFRSFCNSTHSAFPGNKNVCSCKCKIKHKNECNVLYSVVIISVFTYQVDMDGQMKSRSSIQWFTKQVFLKPPPENYSFPSCDMKVEFCV
jgi:hypothetical protein